jgi:hypothetical protein
LSVTTILTYADCIDSLADFARLSPEGISVPLETLKRCVLRAYEDIINAGEWSFLKQVTRLTLQAPQTTGTVQFDLTGGTYERELTLSGATWPSWTTDAVVQIGDVMCDVEVVYSTTVLTLKSDTSPVADVAAGTSYTLWPKWYILPADFSSLYHPMSEDDWQLGEYARLEDVELLNRYEPGQSGSIVRYSIGPAEGIYNRQALYTWPHSSETRSLDVVYNRRPRALRHSGKELRDWQGTITGSSLNATLAGTSTGFVSTMAGSIVRSAGTATDKVLPTGWDGKNPRINEQSILSVNSTTSISMTDVFQNDVTDVSYVISDPVDLPESLHQTMHRVAEMHLARRIGMKNLAAFEKSAKDAIMKAKAADYGQRRGREVAGVYLAPIMRLADASDRPDVSI